MNEFTIIGQLYAQNLTIQNALQEREKQIKQFEMDAKANAQAIHALQEEIAKLTKERGDNQGGAQHNIVTA